MNNYNEESVMRKFIISVVAVAGLVSIGSVSGAEEWDDGEIIGDEFACLIVPLDFTPEEVAEAVAEAGIPLCVQCPDSVEVWCHPDYVPPPGTVLCSDYPSGECPIGEEPDWEEPSCEEPTEEEPVEVDPTTLERGSYVETADDHPLADDNTTVSAGKTSAAIPYVADPTFTG